MRGNGGREYDWVFALILLAVAGMHAAEKISEGAYVELALGIVVVGAIIVASALMMQYMGASGE